MGQTSNANSRSIMAEGDIDNLTLKEYLALTRGNQALGVVKPEMEAMLGTMNRQLLDSHGPIPGMTPAQALIAIQTMADHSQKWHDGSSSRNIENNSNTKEIVAIVSKLDNLDRDMKKLKENVHAIQIGCQLCGGAHLDKECPLNKEVKSVEEVKYGEFGRSSPFINGAKYRVGPPRYYTRINNHLSFGEKRPRLEELLNKHLEEATRWRAKMEEWGEFGGDDE
ncbi:hypothetical protein Tco_0942182 [Tanacetum coccineum]